MRNGSALVLFKNDKKEEVFLVLRSDYPIWGTTGGGIEPGEKPEATAVREAVEETGFKVKLVRKVGVYKSNYSDSNLFEGRVLSGIFKPEFPGCRGKWFGVNCLPLSMTDWDKERVADCLNYQKEMFVKKNAPLSFRGNFHLLFLHPISTFKYLIKSKI